MPADDSTLTTRYTFQVALIYLLIRGIPDLLFYGVSILPPDIASVVLEGHRFWLSYLFPVVPIPVSELPLGFQQALGLLPILIIEVLLVFLFSVWFIQRRPWCTSSPSKRRWLVLILAVAVGTFAVRLPMLAYVERMVMDDLLARRGDASWVNDLPFLLMTAHWTLIAVVYATTPLWAWLPTWLHFRFVKKPTLTANGVTRETGTTVIAAPLQQATVFVSFLLGCVSLHFVLIQFVYMGLWPWAVDRSGLYLPPDALAELGLPLTLSHIVFATFMSALAAWVYARRFAMDVSSTVRLFIRPWFAGFAAYLLTCFLFLALLWLALWLHPQFIDVLLHPVSYAPESGITFVVAFNVVALVVLCFISSRFRVSPLRWSGVLSGLILCFVVPSYVGWTLASSNMGKAGNTPGVAVTGELDDARWRSMEQWCTGVIQTRHGTWLIGRNEDSLEQASYVPGDVPNLSTLVTAEQQGEGAMGYGMFGSRPTLTTLALLQDDGRFKIMATVPDVACMVVSPESETLYLFTGVKRPRSSSSSTTEQTAIFRSTDHGASWEWLQHGFMPDVKALAWSLKPTFASDRDVWAWGTEPPTDQNVNPGWGRPASAPPRRAPDGTELRPTALFYSGDQGETSTVIYSPEPFVVPLSTLQEMAGEPNAKFSSSRSGDQRRFITQVDDNRAYAWVSERTWYHVGDNSKRLMLTTRAELARTDANDEWIVTEVIHQPDVALHHVSTAADGRTYAILHDGDGEWLVKLDTETGEWSERQKTPSLLPDWLAQDDTSVRYFWNNGDYQVISKWGYTRVPRLLIPFSAERAEINTDAHFYTHDGGRSWRQLAIPDYLGVMGLALHGSKLYWSQGNWYRNDEPRQWEYDLAK